MVSVKITKIDISKKTTRELFDCVAEEKPLHIFLNGTHYVTIFCLSTKEKELALGHLIAEGIVRSLEEIAQVSIEKKSVCQVKLRSDVNLESRLKLWRLNSRVILSGCGGRQVHQLPGRIRRVKIDTKVGAEILSACVSSLNTLAELFRKTGGVHAAALFQIDGRLVAVAEDVGRHNAVDKVIGDAALKGTDFSRCILALTGRLTADLVSKAARTGVPIVASLAAAIDSGIIVAKKTGITLAGFVRGKRMNVYSFPERIVV